MSSDPTKYFGFTFHEFTELVYTVKIAQLSTQAFVRLLVTVPSNVKPKYFLGLLDISKKTPNPFNRFD